MAKETYDLDTGIVSKSHSLKPFICVLLMLIAVCTISSILLVVWKFQLQPKQSNQTIQKMIGSTFDLENQTLSTLSRNAQTLTSTSSEILKIPTTSISIVEEQTIPEITQSDTTSPETSTTNNEEKLQSWPTTEENILEESTIATTQLETETSSIYTDLSILTKITTRADIAGANPETIMLLSHPTSTKIQTTLQNNYPDGNTLSMLTSNNTNKCDTPVCKVEASKMLLMRSFVAKICRNFYSYSCGGSQIRPSSKKTILSSNKKFTKPFKSFYKKCIKHEKIFNRNDRIKNIDNTIIKMQSLELEHLVAKLIATETFPFFDIGINLATSEKLVLELTLPKQSALNFHLNIWSSPLKKKCLLEQELENINSDEIFLEDVYSSYTECNPKYELINDRLIEHVTSGELDIFTKDHLNTISTVASFLKKKKSYLKPILKIDEKSTHLITINELQGNYSLLNWTLLFQALNVNTTNLSIQETISLRNYFANLSKEVLANIAKNDFKLYLIAIFANHLFEDMYQPHDNKDNFCFDLTKRLYSEIWSKYAFQSKQDDYKKKHLAATHLFNRLKKQLGQSLRNMRWRPEFAEKLEQIQLALFTHPPDDINNSRNALISQDFISELHEVLIGKKRKIFATQGTILTPKLLFTYFIDPTSKKPFGSYSSNQIGVPDGLLKNALDLPDHLVLAKIAFPIAVELARHFDLMGMKGFIHDDKMKTLKFKTDYYYYQTITFNEIRVNFEVNGDFNERYRNEKIRENAAFKLISDVFVKNSESMPFTPTPVKDQFFIATAQEFCGEGTWMDFMLEMYEADSMPNSLHVENIFGNSMEFIDSYCAKESIEYFNPNPIQFPYVETQPTATQRSN